MMSGSDIQFESIFADPPRNGIYKNKDFQGRGTKLVKMSQLFGERRIKASNNSLELIVLTEREKARLLLRKKDLLFSRTSVVADGVGKCSLVTEISDGLTWDSNIIRIRIDSAKACAEYYFYFFNSPAGRALVLRLSSGAAITTITGTGLAQVNVPYPDLPTQRKIAGILSAYDDLIENNLRRIKILEQMAQSLYREWFVHFRFPGHESAKCVDSPLGKIPKGWGVVSFTELAEILGGGTPKTAVDEYWNGEIPFFSPKDSPSSFYVLETEKTITEEGLKKCASKLFEKNTVFITARGTVGKVAMPSRPMAMNQSCYALRGKEGYSQQFLFLATKEQVSYLKTNTGGATFDTIIVDTFHRMLVVKPPLPLATDFTTRIAPLIETVNNLSKRNQTLRSTRDLLLPKLLQNDPLQKP